MTILLITEFFPDLKRLNFSGGVETRTFFIAKNLARRHKVIVISRRKRGEKKKEETGGLKILRLGIELDKTEAKFSSIFFRLIFIVQSFIIGRKFQPDLVEGSNFICFPPAWLLAKVKNVSSVAWYPDLLGRKWVRKFGVLTGLPGLILEKLSLLLSWNKIIALSQETKKKLIKAGIKKEKISVVYGGVALEFIHRIKARKFSQPTICCVSRLMTYKNIDCLVKAIASIKDKISDIQLVIIGKGPEKKNLRKLVKKLRLEGQVFFKQDLRYKDLLSVLKGSKVFCLPSEIEGFGLVIIEAASSGVPFVVADLPISREVSRDRGGLFFKRGDWRDLARKISQILQDKNLYLKLRREARELARFYSWSKMSLQTEKIYKKSLSFDEKHPHH